ncbi:VOC family protein [Propionimicrobium sp. PCR01-08-3]|uniref:VOC family protein n=1 Tax=Propionimicrobium sp. PCR01-08-3 TaxID=3052086 RepID=UPI00255CAAB5|nr:VOC family protein [Propionimicrobium sp. PCR01-08-3]WIY83573.1 VOC family protein [Propionimicrobium sp. PCR01-08-3]
MAIARTPVFVYDCPDPHALAEFYRGLLGGTIDEESDDHWVDLLVDAGGCISFQQVEDYRAPKWPGQEVPQQLHLDVDVDDLDLAEAAVLQLGAVKHEVQPSERGSFRVFLDPAGHPFCLCEAASEN